MSAAKEKDVEMGGLLDKKPEETVTSKAERQNSNSKALISCALYSFCSVSMVLVNKSLVSRSVPNICDCRRMKRFDCRAAACLL